MLQALRVRLMGWFGIAAIGVVVIVFALFFGIQSYFQPSTSTDLAKVGDTPITQQAFQQQMNQLRQQARDPQSPMNGKDFSDPEVRHQVLDRLINQTLLQQANEKLGVTVTNAMVRQRIATMPAFQINGQFDEQTYTAILRQQGRTPQGFQELVRGDLAMQVIPQAVSGSALVTRNEVDQYLRMSGQTRDVHYLHLPAPEVDAASISDDQIEAYYKAHTDDFMNPETVTIHYVEVKAANMETNVELDDSAIRARYEQEKNHFVVPEQRKVSHILIALPDNPSDEQKAEAKSKAEAIEKKLADGAQFAALAKEDSDDLGSKRQGGSLGWIEQDTAGEAFDKAAFSLAAGQVSDPVLTPEGYHIIKVDEIKPGHTKSLEEVHDQIVHEMLASERERKYNDLAGRLVDLTYQDPMSLKPAAEKLGLEIQTAGPFTRDGGSGIASQQAVIEAAFSDQVLNQGMSSDSINLGDDTTVVLRVTDHAEAAPKPLDSVRDQVRKAALAEQVEDQAKQRAQKALAKVRDSGSLEAVAKQDGLTVQQAAGVQRFPAKLAPAAMEKLFKMPHPSDGGASFAAVPTQNGNYTLLQLDAVHPGDLSEVSDQQRQAVAQRLRGLNGSVQLMAMLKVLRANTKITIDESKFRAQRPD